MVTAAPDWPLPLGLVCPLRRPSRVAALSWPSDPLVAWSCRRLDPGHRGGDTARGCLEVSLMRSPANRLSLRTGCRRRS